MTVTAERPTGVDPRALITPDLFDRLVARITDDHPEHAEHAADIMSQALAFLTACGSNPGAGLSPSKLVDVGWHVFLAYTREYAAFCDLVADRFIHHMPTDTPDTAIADPVAAVGATVAAMRAAGLPVIPELWIAGSECSQCYAGCADDPKTEG